MHLLVQPDLSMQSRHGDRCRHTPMRGREPSGKDTCTARMVRSDLDRLCSWRCSMPSRAPHTLTTDPPRMVTCVLRLPTYTCRSV